MGDIGGSQKERQGKVKAQLTAGPSPLSGRFCFLFLFFFKFQFQTKPFITKRRFAKFLRHTSATSSAWKLSRALFPQSLTPYSKSKTSLRMASSSAKIAPTTVQFDLLRADKYFDSGGTRVAYLDINPSADPKGAVILVHGTGGSIASWSDANGRTPKNTFPNGLAHVLVDAHFRVVLIDLRAHGRSAKPYRTASYGIKLVEDVINLADHLGMKQFHLGGISVGSEISIKAATLHHDRVLSVAALESGWTPVGESGYPLIARILCCCMTCCPCVFPCICRANSNMWQDPVAIACMAQRQNTILSIPQEEMAQLPMPVLSVTGELDPEKRHHERMSGVVANWRMVVIPGKGHGVSGMEPLFRKTVLEFIVGVNDTTSGASASVRPPSEVDMTR